VAALDLAGDEAGFPIAPHLPAYRHAAGRNLPRTAHAGEASGAESVWDTLRALRPARIGHGVRSIEDPILVEHLRAESIHLEVCPTSNMQTNVYAAFTDHPINRLYELGVSLSVNTDTRTISAITLGEEYMKLTRFFAWGRQHFLRCNLEALRASFLPQSTRRELEKQLQESYLTP
jgi:adenosine deaminase